MDQQPMWGPGSEAYEEPVRAPKIVRIYKPGTQQEPDPPNMIALVGNIGMPVYRAPLLHSLEIAYLGPQLGYPRGCLLIGPGIDLIAMAWTCSLTATDRALLEAMRITPNFVPDLSTVEAGK
jgi:hypothetical protein